MGDSNATDGQNQTIKGVGKRGGRDLGTELDPTNVATNATNGGTRERGLEITRELATLL